ncbi:HlyD family secretion protein [Gilvibacter sp.]|uniref:HlyD family secretion protein n=1 Tax=Gilvibacter sp. TaxID=2729997 RepID=UPI003F4A220B
MLNISQEKLNQKVSLDKYKAAGLVFHKRHFKYFNRFLKIFAVIFLVVMFLPWTQNVSGNGFLTTLAPEVRPQTIQSPIPGTVAKWYVQEGDFVKKGDTILHITEIKSEYFDPEYLARTGRQIDAKSLSSESYESKVQALEGQIAALYQERGLKTQQAQIKIQQNQFKVTSDSVDLIAARINDSIAIAQFKRSESLLAEGLKSRTQLEDKRQKAQETAAKLVAQQNKLLASRNELINSRIELNRIQAEYADKLAKAESDKFTAASSKFSTDAEVAKLESQYASFEVRSGLYYIKAPQDGYINRAIVGGVGETIKEGDPIIRIMPSGFSMAIETYVSPIDIPLIHVGEQVRVQFDGWPAIIFSGWPNVSYGTYGGVVVAIDTYISDNGKYRVLIAQDPNDHEWPEELRIGSGAFTLALLNDVPIWFELWRQLNGFPPDYYLPEGAEKKESTKKKK